MGIVVLNSPEIEEAEQQQDIVEEVETAPVPFKTWYYDDVRNYVTSLKQEDLIDPVEMPKYVDLGPYFITKLQTAVGELTPNYEAIESSPKFRETFYTPLRTKIAENHSIRMLVYKTGHGMNNQIINSWPPEPHFLMPVLNYNEYQQGRAKGMILASNELTMLVLRTNKTYKITGKEIEPEDANKMKMPYSFPVNHLPSRAGYAGAQHSMKTFCLACEEAHLAVYARKTYPTNKYEREDIRLTRIT